MINFDLSAILPAFIGGLLIAFASTINLLLKGRITGMSGIFNGIITFDNTFPWKSSFLAGLLMTTGIAFHIYGFNEVAKNTYFFDSPQSFSTGASTLTLIFAGLLVGLGTKLGNGCTSGHGVCGLPRLSLRSLVAVLTFMATGAIMANVKYYLFPHDQEIVKVEGNPTLYVNAAMGLGALIMLVNLVRNKKGFEGLTDLIVGFVVGHIFTVGLLVSGMTRRSKVLGFLTLNENWDMSLMFVMGGAVLFNLVTFGYIINVLKKPILADKMSIPTAYKIDLKLVAGAALFGLGWGLGGICPGPSMIVSPIYLPAMIKFMAGMTGGQYMAMSIEKQMVRAKTE